MFTQKMKACLAIMALGSITIIGCTKKQSTYSVNDFPNKAEVHGVVVSSSTTNGVNTYTVLPGVTVSLDLNAPVEGDNTPTNNIKTLTTTSAADGTFSFINLPVDANNITTATIRYSNVMNGGSLYATTTTTLPAAIGTQRIVYLDTVVYTKTIPNTLP